MKNIALGQYYPSNSHIHRLDGRIKLILSILFIVCTFLCKSAVSFVFLLIGTAALVCIAKIPLGVVLRSVRGIIFILIFTFCINMFFTKGEGAPLFEWRFIVLYREGIWNAAFTALRILALIIGSSNFHVVHDNADRTYRFARESAFTAKKYTSPCTRILNDDVDRTEVHPHSCRGD